MTPSAIDRAAAQLATARQERRRVTALPADCRPTDEFEAYRVQQAAHRLMTDAGAGERVGFKIGCTTEVMQKFLNIGQPAAGGIFAPTCHRDTVTIRADDFRKPGVECEIAVRLGHDVTAEGAPFTAEGLRAAVATVMPAIELVDDRYDDYAALGAPTLIADDFFNAGAVLGPETAIGDVADIADVPGRMTINGTVVGQGRSGDIMGHPLNALAWIADFHTGFDLVLPAGSVILLGSLVETRWVNRGDHVTIDLDGLGQAELRVD